MSPVTVTPTYAGRCTPLSSPAHSQRAISPPTALTRYCVNNSIFVLLWSCASHRHHSDIDFALICENTGGEYSGLEHQCYSGIVEPLKVSTRAKAERISCSAFDFTLRNGCKVRSNRQLPSSGAFCSSSVRMSGVISCLILYDEHIDELLLHARVDPS
ncbi:hypothetical protein DFH94DRAFT_51720 [Russula ochroleuca]|uniref:Uncharacterized protein n=1 Tax=Russula ochroleuca TaxID=152965 RepID=A0A9P5MV99_9AGAM|nr:hypothetical protein DFH94DRAFT_51720 [Russula ochroleuca]